MTFRADSTRLDALTAARLAGLARTNVIREFPNHPGHALEHAGDVGTPRELHPAFYGSYDWHSCVHMHWLLARVRRLFPDVHRESVEGVLNAHLGPRAIDGEVAYFQRPGARAFERTYGWGWLLLLAGELHLAAQAGDHEAGRWSGALAPLTGTIVERFLDYLPRARYPIRHGMHANSAFGLACALDFATTCGHGPLLEAARATARMFYEADRDLPAQWEPSGADFLSPALVEADLMRRVLSHSDFSRWVEGALPGLAHGQPGTLFEPAGVSDRRDPQIVHLDGLNLSRAWCFRGIARTLAGDDPRAGVLLAAAERHLRAGLTGLASTDYYGTHWLATFALRALTA